MSTNEILKKKTKHKTKIAKTSADSEGQTTDLADKFNELFKTEYPTYEKDDFFTGNLRHTSESVDDGPLTDKPPSTTKPTPTIKPAGLKRPAPIEHETDDYDDYDIDTDAVVRPNPRKADGWDVPAGTTRNRLRFRCSR